MSSNLVYGCLYFHYLFIVTKEYISSCIPGINHDLVECFLFDNKKRRKCSLVADKNRYIEELFIIYWRL